jgi:hypothetical protein
MTEICATLLEKAKNTDKKNLTQLVYPDHIPIPIPTWENEKN